MGHLTHGPLLWGGSLLLRERQIATLSDHELQWYLDTVRGKGGIRQARSPAELRVGATVRKTEEDLTVMGCRTETEGSGRRQRSPFG